MTEKPTLMYFDFSFWKAEVPRLCYHISGTEFEDKRLTREQQQDMKAKGELPFGQVPILYVKDKWLTQGTAITRYVGKQTGFYPKDDFEGGKVDEVLNLLEDAQYNVSPSMREEDEQKKKELRKKFADEFLPTFFSNLEKLLTENEKHNSGSKFFVGKNMTVADLAVWRIVGWFQGGKLDDVPTDLADKYPKLKACREAVDANEKIGEWKKKHSSLYN